MSISYPTGDNSIVDSVAREEWLLSLSEMEFSSLSELSIFDFLFGILVMDFLLFETFVEDSVLCTEEDKPFATLAFLSAIELFLLSTPSTLFLLFNTFETDFFRVATFGEREESVSRDERPERDHSIFPNVILEDDDGQTRGGQRSAQILYCPVTTVRFLPQNLRKVTGVPLHVHVRALARWMPAVMSMLSL